MRYLSMIRIDERTAQQPSERLQAEMGELIEEWTKSGKLVRTAGLRPTKEGVRVRSEHGKISRTDGPFTEAKEVIGGRRGRGHGVCRRLRDPRGELDG